MPLKYINSEEAEKITKEKGIHILTITAPWCGACQMIAPVLEDLAKEHNVWKLNSDENKEFVAKLGVKGIPVSFIFKDGKEEDSIMGYAPKEAFELKLNSLK